MKSDELRSLNLSNRIILALERYGIYTITRLKFEINRNQLKNVRSIGPISRNQIMESLKMNDGNEDSKCIRVICIQNFGKPIQDSYNIYKLIKCNFVSLSIEKNIPFYVEIDSEGNYTLFTTTLLPMDKNSIIAKVKELVNLSK